MKLVSDSLLFVRHTRDTYKAAKGVQAKKFDPTKPVKLWYTDIITPTAYTVVDYTPNAVNGVKERVYSVEEAGAVNIPGHFEDGTVNPVFHYPTPYTAIPPQDVEDLAALLKGTAGTDSGVGAGGGSWPVINVDGVTIRAWTIVPRWYELGRNRKGRWYLQAGVLELDPDPVIETIQPYTPKEEPAPIHPLAAGEKVIFPIMGSPVIVGPSDATVASASGAAFTDNDRALLMVAASTGQQILAILQGK